MLSATTKKVLELNGQFLEIGEDLARPIGLTAGPVAGPGRRAEAAPPGGWDCPDDRHHLAERPAHGRDTPTRANPIEVASPIPDAAPVTSATRPSMVAIFLIIPALGSRVGENFVQRRKWIGRMARRVRR